MADGYDMPGLLLGRIDVLRSTMDEILYELANYSSDDKIKESLSQRLEKKLDSCDKNLRFLANYGSKFETETNTLSDVTQSNKNLLMELQWKKDVQNMGNQYGEYIYPPKPPNYFTLVPIADVKQRDNDDKPVMNLDHTLEAIAKKNSSLVFYKETVTGRYGRKMIRSIKCEVNKEFVVLVSFQPAVSQLGSLESGSASMTPNLVVPSTPASPAPVTVITSRRRSKGKARTKPKKCDDMVAKAKQAAEEATKHEYDELNTRINAAKEATKEQELVRSAALEITSCTSRVLIASIHETNIKDTWDESQYLVYRKMTIIAQEAMRHFTLHYPETALRHFFSWMDKYHNLYQTKCCGCSSILAADSNDMFLPPTFRDYSNGNRAYHPACLPNQKSGVE